MLMGDKIETATCNAVSSRLAERSQGIFKIVRIPNRTDARRALRFRTRRVPMCSLSTAHRSKQTWPCSLKSLCMQ